MACCLKEIKGASLRVASDLTGVTGVQTEALKRRCGSTRTKKKKPKATGVFVVCVVRVLSLTGWL